jgi:hypothetical protein
MINIPYDRTYLKGTWKDKWTSRGRFVFMTCPICGTLGSLSDHIVAKDGTVSPSVECPGGCGFHDYIKLEGWIS